MTVVVLLCGCSGCSGCSGCGDSDHKTEATEDYNTATRVTLLFGGDVMQHLPQITAAQQDSIFDYTDSFQYLKPIFDSTDLVILNFESTISANQRYSGYPLFASPAQIMKALKASGVDAVMLANNHICDKGATGIAATIAEVERVELRYSGAFADSAGYRKNNPLLLESKGIRFAILNYTYATNGMPVPKGSIVNIIDTTRIVNDLKLIDHNNVDHTILFLHWGNEYWTSPTNSQQEFARWCHQQGVDFVIGSHPHVIAPVEVVRDSGGRIEGATAYSLGNLISNQRWRRSDGGMLLKVEIIHRDSLPPKIEVGYILVWVDTPIVDGRQRYHILPKPVADTIIIEGSQSRSKYNQFLSDSRNILNGDTAVRELFP